MSAATPYKHEGFHLVRHLTNTTGASEWANWGLPAVTALLRGSFPAVFTGAGAATLAWSVETFTVDPMSADPVAGEPGPEDAVDVLAFDPAAPAGPYALTRPPYAGPKRVYLRSAAGDLAALLPAEQQWSAADPARFTLQPRAGRLLAPYSQVQVQYGVVAAGTRMKTLHQITLTLSGADVGKSEQALALALAALGLNREALRQQAAFDYSAGNYRTQGTLKSLSFAGGGSGAPKLYRLQINAEIDLKLQRLLGADEGRPITHIVTPGRPLDGRAIVIDPTVQS
mgnify:CR=1 FL=1